MECFLDYYDPVVRGTCHLLKDSQNNTSFNEAIHRPISIIEPEEEEEPDL